MMINRRQDRSSARAGPSDLRGGSLRQVEAGEVYSKAAAIVGERLVSNEWLIADGERLMVVVCVRPTGSGEGLPESLLL